MNAQDRTVFRKSDIEAKATAALTTQLAEPRTQSTHTDLTNRKKYQFFLYFIFFARPKMEKPQSKVLLLGDPGVGKVLFHPSVPYLLPRLTRSGPAVQTSLAIQLAHNAFLGTTRNHLTVYYYFKCLHHWI